MTPDDIKAAMAYFESVTIDYTNYRGERSLRQIIPRLPYMTLRATAYHPEVQWILTAFDVEKKAERDFAMAGIKGWFNQRKEQDAEQVQSGS